MVLFLHFASRGRDLSILTKIDFRFRIIVVTALIAFALYTLVSSAGILPDWLAYKTIIFASLVFCGLMIRLKLRTFAPAFKKLVEGTHSAADSRNVGRSLVSSRPYVFAIWIGLLLNTALSLRLIQP
jgi:prepilin signal peptidase PulO-like enzyme (type II secretory pathway)